LPADTGDFGPGGIWRWLEGEQITMLHTVPTLTQSWLDQLPWGASLHSLRWVFFTGEPLTDTLVRRWRECLPDSGRVINFYGPTETTMVKCFYRVPEDMLPGVQPLGWPLPQSQALVLKENHQLCGIGESGEIVLRTPFRTLGYLNAPEENARRFIKNPYRDDDQDLLYFTGDLGRYRPDGALEILGRLDHQVKIRGVRVEPDEVTAVLLQHPAVRAGVVIAREDEAGQHYLVAYLVVAEPDEALKRALRAYLSGQLPAAMIPAAFVFLEQLPLTPNGKVDRRALPAPDRALSQPEDTFVAPRTPVEETLAGIWARVLGLERVGVHNTFFELGGHSLLATRVVSHIRQACRVELPLRSLFETPTIAGLAETIEQMMRNGAELSAPSILPVSREAYRRRLP
jgi:acyl-coenzyme A synthetase/AMP-(fatty) acid ligase/acyl carrier protein